MSRCLTLWSQGNITSSASSFQTSSVIRETARRTMPSRTNAECTNVLPKDEHSEDIHPNPRARASWSSMVQFHGYSLRYSSSFDRNNYLVRSTMLDDTIGGPTHSRLRLSSKREFYLWKCDTQGRCWKQDYSINFNNKSCRNGNKAGREREKDTTSDCMSQCFSRLKRSARTCLDNIGTDFDFFDKGSWTRRHGYR